MGVAHRARDLLRDTGIEVSRLHSKLEWKRNLLHQLKSARINVVLDVGANSGQYGADLRSAGYEGRIISFEPLSGPYSELQRRASGDPLWESRQCALGDSDGTISINVAGNAGESSSALPMLESHQDACPSANYVGSELVPLVRLDSVAPEFLRQTDIAFLKIDVQGFEKHVLAGSASTVNERCAGMQLELSFLPLYEGGMLIREALDIADSMGFTLTGLSPCFVDPRSGRTLQADGTFFRSEH